MTGNNSRCPKCGSDMNNFLKEQICTNDDCKHVIWIKGGDLTLAEIAIKDRIMR